MKSSIIKIFFLSTIIALSAPSFVFAVNDVQIDDVTTFELKTADTATDTTVSSTATGQVTNLDVGINYIDITLDNASFITFNISTGGQYLRITKQSGSADYNINPSCPTTTVYLTGSGAAVVMRLEVITTNNCGGGGGGGGGAQNTAPTNFTFTINNGQKTSVKSDVTLNLSAQNAQYAMIGNDSGFLGASWISFTSPSNIPWTLTSGLGVKTVYVKFKSSDGQISSVQTSSIEVISSTAPEIPEEPLPPGTIPQGTIPPGTTPTPAGECNGVTVYQHINYQGNSQTFYDNVPDFRTMYIGNDQISSLKILGNTEIEVFENINYLGKKQVFSQDIADLRGTYIGNDTISSLNVKSPTQGCVAPVTTSGVTVFENINYKGKSETYYGNVSDLRKMIIGNDKISSMKVLGDTAIQVFEHINYLGRNQIFTSDIADLRGTIIGNDTISSIKIISTTESQTMCTAGVTFTQDLSFGSIGGQVSDLQELLECLGYFPSSHVITNYFGTITEDSVKKFQGANGLTQNGIVDAKTRDAMNKY